MRYEKFTCDLNSSSTKHAQIYIFIYRKYGRCFFSLHFDKIEYAIDKNSNSSKLMSGK